MGLKIISPGLLTTIQDIGRFGFRKDGIILSGAMDTAAIRLGNILLGNEENEGVLEITLIGPKIYFEEDQLIALTGGNLSPQVNGEAVSMWRPIFIRKGCTLTFARALHGCRTYLAVAGGLDIPKVMDSASTYLRAAIGGWKGRALQSGDSIPCKHHQKEESFNLLLTHFTSPKKPHSQAHWAPSPLLLPDYRYSSFIRVIEGPEYDWFTYESKEHFLTNDFLITPQSDRMGYRLKGPDLTAKERRELLSTAVTFGTIQIPAEGTPIILMADHPTTGGYPRIAQVITADLPKLAQTPPGKNIKFKKVSLQEAQELLYIQEQNINAIKKAIATKLISGSYAEFFNRP